MGDDTSVQTRESFTISCSPAVGDVNADIPNEKKFSRQNENYQRASDSSGVDLVRKKSYHPELSPLRADVNTSLTDKQGIRVLSHKMELLHLNRTCTSVDLLASFAHAPLPRSASDANLTDEEKVHKIRHQVSFAAPDQKSKNGTDGRACFECSDLLEAFKTSASRTDDTDDDDHVGVAHGHWDTNVPLNDDQEYPDIDDDVDLPEAESYSFSSCGRSLSLDRLDISDADYLAVRPSLASTQLNESNRN